MAKKVKKLVIIGGAEARDKEGEILTNFVELAGNDNAHIVVLDISTQPDLETLRKYPKTLS